jgi:hypothetical protein
VRIDIYGLGFEAPGVTFYLWSPWRASALEHRLFDAVHHLPGVEYDSTAEERRVHVTQPKTFRAALQAVSRVLKGWQEDADPASERRGWRWLLEGDTDADGYDHAREPASLWGFLRLVLDRGGPDEEADKGEDIDLEGFGLRVWGERTVR